MTGRRWAAVRISTALLLGSGVLMVLSAFERWWPACAPGAGGSGACERIQDHLYDFTWPLAPWEPVGSAAELFGVATLLLALAFVFLPVLVSRGAVPLVAWASGAVLAVSFGLQGAQGLLSGLTGEAVDVPMFAVRLWGQALLVPLVLAALALWPATRARPVPAEPRAPGHPFAEPSKLADA